MRRLNDELLAGRYAHLMLVDATTNAGSTSGS
jgi:hypothetical protein